MQWTAQIIVVLLNIVWIAFFLQPHPFSMFVQRRNTENTDEEMLFGEFCIQPQSDMHWTSNLHSVNITSNKTINTTSEASEGSNRHQEDQNKTESQQSRQCNDTHTQKKDLSQLSDIDLRPPAPGCEPKIIDSDGMTPSSPPLLGQTSSEVTSAIELTTTNQNQGSEERSSVHQLISSSVQISSYYGTCCLGFIRGMKANTKKKIESYMIQEPDGDCNIRAVLILIKKRSTHKKRQILCANPEEQWVKDLVEVLNRRMQN
ncbi:uncharacterized protein LOC122973332 [Thunnus albacares]|uniref:uncharacterized protein LOC122973332 n=1 Tax=Thunnus albacares TaxID=8236 RepID=UPI001CF6B026|nr:uncharacterized protein LOC122973332 [Thunnus albacares]